MKLPDVLKKSPERPYVLAVHETISPSLIMLAFDDVARVWRNVFTDLKSKQWGMPIRELFNRPDEGAKEIDELWPTAGQIARESEFIKHGFLNHIDHQPQRRPVH